MQKLIRDSVEILAYVLAALLVGAAVGYLVVLVVLVLTAYLWPLVLLCWWAFT